MEDGLTFSQTFELGEYSNYPQYSQLVIICYFALTTLSTVGYGDMYPISNLEKISAVIIMLCGVAFFSFIMGNFIENLKNYDSKMGTPDKADELQKWIISLQRYTQQTPLPFSIVEDIEKSMSYYWQQNRLSSFDGSDNSFDLLPQSIKKTMLSEYLFCDINLHSKRLLTDDIQNDKEFMAEFTKGFMPRRFMDVGDDRIIYEEEQEVAEMYFITKGFIGIGYNYWGGKLTENSYIIAKRQKGR